MPDNTETIGQCPNCGDPLTAAWTLVEYEKADGTAGVWAECPTCADVVAPE
ncbi:hypothetical protein ACODNH_01870 (plasmid) [Haloarcula sp. NS06]|uniref:DUF7837 domain-containing protein n=1 Tax=Haloarcula quadrata TaxID=182779 RepID=A0A495QQG1_9EURY|nr:hypothetical protein [Haloarcula quadrata]RKS75742.1 hypothetical protein BDK61_4257 [Haloarcula quadrata]